MKCNMNQSRSKAMGGRGAEYYRSKNENKSNFVVAAVPFSNFWNSFKIIEGFFRVTTKSFQYYRKTKKKKLAPSLILAAQMLSLSTLKTSKLLKKSAFLPSLNTVLGYHFLVFKGGWTRFWCCLFQIWKLKHVAREVKRDTKIRINDRHRMDFISWISNCAGLGVHVTIIWESRHLQWEV